MHAAALQRQTRRLRATVDELLHASDKGWPLQVADDFLRAAGYALLAWSWCRIARAAADAGDSDLRAAQAQASEFGLRFVLADAEPHWQRLVAGTFTLPDIA
jgi:hypothetical protein